MHYKCKKVILNHGRSFIDSSNWIENKRAAINPKNKYDNCFQYALTAALSQENIKNCLERMSNVFYKL